MTAAEAWEITENHWLAFQLEVIYESIKKAALIGRTSATFIDLEIEIRERLLIDGYSVEQFDFCLRVSWNNQEKDIVDEE